MSDVLDLLAMWGLLQVLFVWCVDRAGRLRALRCEQYIAAAARKRTERDWPNPHRD